MKTKKYELKITISGSYFSKKKARASFLSMLRHMLENDTGMVTSSSIGKWDLCKVSG